MSDIDEAVVNTPVEDTTTQEATTVEQEQSENTDQLFEKMFGDDDPSSGVEEEAEPKAEEPKEEAPENEPVDEKPKRGAEARKEQLSSEIDTQQEEIRSLVEEKNRILAEKAQLEQEIATAQKQEELPTVESLQVEVNPLTGEYYTEFEAQAIVENLTLRQKLEDIERARQIDEVSRQLADSVKTLSDDANRALKDFPEFDEQSKEYNAELAEKAFNFVNASLIRDPNTGQVLDSHIPLYDIYETLSTAGKTGKRAGNATNYTQQANADVVGGATGATTQDQSKSFVDNFFDD